MRTRYSITHNEIDFVAGMKLWEAVEELLRYKETGEKVYGNFNGQILYSDSISMDSAYMLMFNKTRAEAEREEEEKIEKMRRETTEHKARIPELSKVWEKKGALILEEDKLEYWNKIVPIRLGDLYKGMELGQTLDVIQLLQQEKFEEAKSLLDIQGHSYMSYQLVKMMIRELDSRGNYFVENYLD